MIDFIITMGIVFSLICVMFLGYYIVVKLDKEE